MKGYLLKEQAFIAGEDTFIESISSENNYAVAFEDDTETGYFYAIELNKETDEQRILDAVHIYEADHIEPGKRPGIINIIWSTDWLKCALLINNYCHAVFNFSSQGGYCRNEFPPPNDIWTKGNRKLTDEMVADFFRR
ncbi:MAG: DUF2251 domain-containing protein [Chitinophagaceae bacterium]